MAENKTNSNAGRKRIEFNLEELEKLCALQPTQEEIAAFFGVSVDTIQSRLKEADFSAAYKRGFDKGKLSLRREQYRLATAGNVTMLIWLGKQYLNQKDRQEITGDPSKPLTYKELSEEELHRIARDGDRAT